MDYIIKTGVAAVDIGSDSFFVAVADQEVRRFGSFTSEIRLLGEFLREQGVTHVAMEATGVYWIPLHDHLDTNGFQVTVFNGAHARNLPGRKTDIADCQWHAMPHSHGLLQPSFIPAPEFRELRSYYRLREDHLEMASMHIQHMQKALDLMNVRLHQVISQINGASGLRVIEAILAGEQDARQLANLCSVQILRHKEKQVLASLEGNWESRHLFALGQALEGHRFFHTQMEACDKRIEECLQRLNQGTPPAAPRTNSKIRHNAPVIQDLHGKLTTLCRGRDATVLPGLSPLGFLKLVSELGTDLSRWKSAKHFTSFLGLALGLAPNRHESGKKRRRVARRKTRAGQIFREASLSLARSKHSALGAFYRRLAANKGPAVAMVALARKLAVLYYNFMTQGLDYVEEGIQNYEARYQAQSKRSLERMARKLGYSLVQTSEIPA